MNKKTFYKRVWLSPKGTAFIEINDGSVRIADYSNVVYLDFEIYDAKSKKDAHSKLDKLITTLTQFKESLENDK
jgi:hypothetical protein